MQTVFWNNLTAGQRSESLQRAPQTFSPSVAKSVEEILAGVRKNGDEAVRDYARRFDGAGPRILKLSAKQIDQAAAKVGASVAKAIETAYQRLSEFHQLGKPKDLETTNHTELVCAAKYTPIDRVGLYVPGGKTPLPSTALMLGVPAQIAGCSDVAICTAPMPGGEMDPATMLAAKLCGIDTVYCIGGAQSIAAMAFGTDSVQQCDKIFGPGGVWVTEAKRQVQSGPSPVTIDMPAGPSEVLVIADAAANPEFVACDMLAQLEHGPDSQAILVTDSKEFAEKVESELRRIIPELSREDIVRQSCEFARIIITEDLSQAADVSNQYAPEHLILQVDEEEQVLSRINTAGSIFVGPWTPEVLGDYCSGTNHVLPTSGFARSLSGLSVVDFMKRITIQRATLRGLQQIAPTACELASYEGLDAHQRAVTVRQAAGSSGEVTA